MSEQIKMTEKDARGFLVDAGIADGEIDSCIIDLKCKSRIRKSDLEILVEEAEENYHNPENEWQESANKLFEAVQALKKLHPEFKK